MGTNDQWDRYCELHRKFGGIDPQRVPKTIAVGLAQEIMDELAAEKEGCMVKEPLDEVEQKSQADVLCEGFDYLKMQNRVMQLQGEFDWLKKCVGWPVGMPIVDYHLEIPEDAFESGGPTLYARSVQEIEQANNLGEWCEELNKSIKHITRRLSDVEDYIEEGTQDVKADDRDLLKAGDYWWVKHTDPDSDLVRVVILDVAGGGVHVAWVDPGDHHKSVAEELYGIPAFLRHFQSVNPAFLSGPESTEEEG